MEDTKQVAKRPKGKDENKIKKIHMYKDAAVKAMEEAGEFDKSIIEANGEYIGNLEKADSTEYEILKMNMENAQTEEERAAIRERMAEMSQRRYEKDTENKEFYEKQQEGHRNHTKQILTSVAIVAGLAGAAYKFRKPLMEAGKVLITKKI